MSLIFLPCYIHAQSLNVNLSPRHSQKLSTIKSGHKRLTKFYKFYKRDSAKHFRKQEKYYKKLLDSTYRADHKQERIRKRLARKGIMVPNNKLSQMDSLDAKLKQWYVVAKDSSASDSLRVEAKQKVKQLALQKASLYPGFQHLMEQYQLNGDSVNWQSVAAQVPGIDTLAGVFDSNPEQLFSMAENRAVSQFQKLTGAGTLSEEFAEAGKLKNLPGQYSKQYEQYTDQERLKEQGKDKAVGEALDYFATHVGKLQMSQAKVSKLLSKYRDISNSEDLSTAVKRTSMQGKTFWEHLVIGGNFNIVSTSPVSIDLSPLLGYKFTTRFSLGVGMNYRHTFRDSIKHNWYVSPVNTSFKGFANYGVFKGFFTYGEWERSRLSGKLNDHAKREWRNNYFVGIGKKILVHPKLYLNTTLLYNLNNEDKNPIHPRRFQIRFGFQLSELATRKERITYDPNR